MKKYLVVMIAGLILLTGCDSSTEDGIKVSSADDYEGQDYQEVLEDFEDDGFTNINLEILDDLITGWLTKDGEVESVSIDGSIDYDDDIRYAADTEIIITYHTFSIDEEDDISDEIDSSVDSDDSDVKDEVDSSDTEIDSSVESDVEPEEHITILNNSEFAEILVCASNSDDKIAEFVQEHKGEIIEFDANIAYVTNHGDYTTRYDILIYSGDYSETTSYGPSFRFSDVNTTNLGISDLYLPSYVSVGSNVHVIAEIKSFDENTLLLELNPISVTER